MEVLNYVIWKLAGAVETIGKYANGKQIYKIFNYINTTIIADVQINVTHQRAVEISYAVYRFLLGSNF